MSITAGEQLRLSVCIQEIAQILYENTASEEIATLEMVNLQFNVLAFCKIGLLSSTALIFLHLTKTY